MSGIIATTVGDLGEKRLLAEVLERIAPPVSEGIGIGDDAALLRPPSGSDLVISTDRVPTDLLALRFGLMSPADLGAYLAEVNISDVVAMAAQPAGLLLNIALPADFPLQDFRLLLKGFIAAGLSHGAPLVGGDTSYAEAPSFSATALGWVPKGSAVQRAGAKSGDKIAVSGKLGGFGAALAYYAALRDRRIDSLPKETERRLLDRLVRPRARSDLLATLMSSPCVHSAIDITDGLGQTLREFAAASEVGILISEASIPIDNVVGKVASITETPTDEIIFGIGLELELLVSIAPSGVDTPEAEAATVIGEVLSDEDGVSVRRADGQITELPGKGWQHFADDAEEMIAGGE